MGGRGLCLMPVPLTHVTVTPVGEQFPPFISRRTLHKNTPPGAVLGGVFSCALAADCNGRYPVVVSPAWRVPQSRFRAAMLMAGMWGGQSVLRVASQAASAPSGSVMVRGTGYGGFF